MYIGFLIFSYFYLFSRFFLSFFAVFFRFKTKASAHGQFIVQIRCADRVKVQKSKWDRRSGPILWFCSFEQSN